MLGRWALLALLAAGAPRVAAAEQPEAEPACAAEEEESDGIAALQTAESTRKINIHAISNDTAVSNDTALGVASGPTCYGYTGGSCSVKSCSAERKSTCSGGYCTCAGGCSGPNGTCYMSQNTKVAESFELANVKYSKYYMYMQSMSTFGQMKVSNSYFGVGGAKFSLYKLPGTSDGQPKFFLGSSKWTSSVAAFSGTTNGLYSTSLEKKYGVDDLAVTVCARTDNTIMIGANEKSSVTGKAIWAYVSKVSKDVKGYNMGDPGKSGYWTSKPPLPANSVPAC